MFTDDDGALREVACERSGKCDVDQRAFKGVAVRSLARAAQAAPVVADSIYKTLNASAKAAALGCLAKTDSNIACSFEWNFGTAEESGAASTGLGELLNALQAVQALLWRTANFTSGTPNSTVSSNGTSSETPSGASGAPQSTGAGSTLAASVTCILAIAFAAALSC